MLRSDKGITASRSYVAAIPGTEHNTACTMKVSSGQTAGESLTLGENLRILTIKNASCLIQMLDFASVVAQHRWFHNCFQR